MRRSKLTSSLTGKSSDGGKGGDAVEVSLLQFFAKLLFIYVLFIPVGLTFHICVY